MIPCGERALWRAVLLRALRDAKYGRKKARRWLHRDNPDFRRVCELAGIDIDALTKKINEGIRDKTTHRLKGR
jgi:hypothetical protein